jgi:hypothetical protein
LEEEFNAVAQKTLKPPIQMKNIFYVFFGLLLSGNHAAAQDQYLNFNSRCKGQHSPFTSVATIDNRANRQLLGYIPIKGFTGLANVRFRGMLIDTLASIFTQQSPDKELVLILNDFFLNGGSNPAKFVLSLRLFTSVNENKYGEILSIDHTYQLNGNLFQMIGDQMCEIAGQASTLTPSSLPGAPSYSLNDLYRLDSLEKLKLPMYMTDKPASGIYKDFTHFKMNSPDISTGMFISISKKGEIQVDRTYKNNGRKVKLDPTGIYAVSDGNRLLKVTSSGEYFEITKQGFNFYFDMPGSFADQPNAFSSYSPDGGRMGATASGDLTIRFGGPRYINNIPFYRFKINYQKGNSVLVGLVEQ